MPHAKLRNGEIKTFDMKGYWALVQALWVGHKNYQELVEYVDPSETKGYDTWKQLGLELKQRKLNK